MPTGTSRRAFGAEHRAPDDRDRHRPADERGCVERRAEEAGALVAVVEQHRHEKRRDQGDRRSDEDVDEGDLRRLDELGIVREQADVVVEPDPAGRVKMLYRVNERYSEYPIGMIVRPKKPTSHGMRNP